MMGQGDPLPQPMPIPTHQPCRIAAKAHQQTIACLLADRLTVSIELGFLNQHPGPKQSSYDEKGHRNRNKTQFH